MVEKWIGMNQYGGVLKVKGENVTRENKESKVLLRWIIAVV